MIGMPSHVEVYLCSRPIDMRKSFEGLCAVVEAVFQRNVLDGQLFLFINKRRDRLKALWWDRDGLVIVYKRLEAGAFEMPAATTGAAHVTLDATALAMLLGGVPLTTPRRKRYQRPAAVATAAPATTTAPAPTNAITTTPTPAIAAT